MKGSSLKYLLKEGVRNLWTNRVMALTSIGVLTTCLLLVGAAYVLTLNVNSMVRFVENQNEMSVFLFRETTEEQISKIRSEIEGTPNVADTTFVSKEEGLEKTMDEFGDDAYLLEDIEDRNPVPDMFVVKVTDIARTAETKAAIEQITGVEKVNAATGMATTLTNVRDIVATLGSTIILALGIISLVIIANTIRATIFTRRKEINIMKFVGATNSFIRIPFLVEGFILGLISALVSYLVIWGAYTYLLGALTADSSSFLQSAFASLIPFRDLAGKLAVFFGATGTVLGTFGSAISIRNHVKV